MNSSGASTLLLFFFTTTASSFWRIARSVFCANSSFALLWDQAACKKAHKTSISPDWLGSRNSKALSRSSIAAIRLVSSRTWLPNSFKFVKDGNRCTLEADCRDEDQIHGKNQGPTAACSKWPPIVKCPNSSVDLARTLTHSVDRKGPFFAVADCKNFLSDGRDGSCAAMSIEPFEISTNQSQFECHPGLAIWPGGEELALVGEPWFFCKMTPQRRNEVLWVGSACKCTRSRWVLHGTRVETRNERLEAWKST